MTTKAQIERERVHNNRSIAFAKRVRNLLGHVGARTAQSLLDARFDVLTEAQQLDYGQAADALAVELAQVEPVGRALMPKKIDAVKSAREHAEQVIERVYAELEKHGWDINAAAPRADSFRMGRTQYQQVNSKRILYSSLTKRPEGVSESYSFRDTGPKIVERDPEGAARFISNSEQDAAYQYDMFICKMVGKVGEVTDASIEGDHVWGHSILTVNLPSGEKQLWKTQQIVNYSVYGRPYLQWPSRTVKGA